MVNKWKLKEILFKRQMNMGSLAEAIGMSGSALSNKTNGKTQFTVKEALDIQNVLGLTDDERNEVFFSASMLKDGEQIAGHQGL